MASALQQPPRGKSYEELREIPLWRLPAWAVERLLAESLRRVAPREKIVSVVFPAPARTADCLEVFPAYKHLLVQQGLWAVFQGWDVRAISREDDSEFPDPTLQRFATGPAEQEFGYREATFILSHPDGKRIIAHIGNSPTGNRSLLSLTCCEADRGFVAQKLDELIAWTRQNSYFRGKLLDHHGRFIPQPRAYGWGDLYLPADLLAAIRRNTQGFFERLGEYRRYSLPTRRGVLLHGRQGGGKTTVVKALASQLASLGATGIMLKPNCIDYSDQISATFDMARDQKPSLLVLEDIDLYAAQRGQGWGDMILGELLDALDGLNELDQIVVLATTNNLAALDEAMRERPHRFDVVLEIPDLDDGTRCRYLRAFVAERRLNNSFFDEIDEATRGMVTIAEVQEASIRVLQRGIESGIDLTAVVSPDDLPELESGAAHEPAQRAMGFAPTGD